MTICISKLKEQNLLRLSSSMNAELLKFWQRSTTTTLWYANPLQRIQLPIVYQYLIPYILISYKNLTTRMSPSRAIDFWELAVPRRTSAPRTRLQYRLEQSVTNGGGFLGYKSTWIILFSPLLISALYSN